MSPLPAVKVTGREQKNLESQERIEAYLVPATPKSLLRQLLAISEARNGEKSSGWEDLTQREKFLTFQVFA